MKEIAERLVSEHSLNAEEFRALIESCDDPTLDFLRNEAVNREVSLWHPVRTGRGYGMVLQQL